MTAEADLHRRVLGKGDVPATAKKVRVDGPASAVGAHEDAQGMRANREPYDNSYKLEGLGGSSRSFR